MSHWATQALDGALTINGEEIILRMVVGSKAATQQFVDCEGIKAVVRGTNAVELAAGIDQKALYCIFSPTQINEKQWPGGQPPGPQGRDPRVPNKNRGDRAYVRGAWLSVQWADGFYPTPDELVRIEMRVLG